MMHGKDRFPQRWKSAEMANSESSDNEESSSMSIAENSPYIKHTSTPIRRGVDEAQRSFRARSIAGDTAEESFDARKREGQSSDKTRRSREKYRDTRDRIGETRKKKRSNRRRARRPGERLDASDEENRKEAQSDSPSSGRHQSEIDVSGKSRKAKNSKKKEFRGDTEVPITEILRRSEENGRTKYEKPAPLPQLTADKIYIQRGNGFSAVKISEKSVKRAVGGEGIKRSHGDVEGQSCPPIRVAIIAQKFWKSTGLVYQGILGGMGLMHFIMLQVFFGVSMEFVAKYSMISEIYANIFSLLAAMCLVSTFDKFDLARLDMEHLREIYVDYGKSAIAIPLYIAIFCLHQVSSKTNDQLALKRYYSLNGSLWENVTNVDDLLDDLNSWQKLAASKDMLAVFAWLFVSLGTRDDAFLIHLESMEKYAGDIRATGQ